MKHLFQYLCVAGVIAMMTACFGDDSTPLGDIDVNEIVVTGIEDNYVKTAFVGEHLTINPQVAGYDDSQLDFLWMIINAQTGKTDAKGDTIQPTILGNEKNLDYEVNLPPSTYQVRLYTTVRSTGLQTVSYATLQVQTNFSKGFYILKETADGNTELDLLTKDDEMAGNLLAATQGAAMAGKPLNLCPNYGFYNINPDNDQMEECAAGLTITTESKGFSILRTTDLKKIFDRSNILYDPMDDGEQVYGIYQTGMSSSTMITSAGAYSASAAGSWSSSPSTGQYGLPMLEWDGASRFYYNDIDGYGGGTIWNEKSHSLTAYNYNLMASPLLFSDFTGDDVTQNLTGYECLHCGFNHVSGAKGVFILRDTATGLRYIYLISGGFRGETLLSRTQLTGHMAKATAYTTNGTSASYVYCLDGGKVYACNIATGDFEEVELKTEGIGSGETITYVTNQFWQDHSANAFDYLVVGTQKGSDYKLYFYDTNGGAPTGAPVKTAQGNGTVKMVRFMNPTFNSSLWMFGYHVFNIND